MSEVLEGKGTAIWLAPGRLTVERGKALVLLFMVFLVAMFHVFTVAFGTLEPYAQRVISLSLIMALAPMLYPLGRKSWWDPFNKWFILDLIIMLIPLATMAYVIANFYEMAYIRMAGATPTDIVLGTLYMATLLELCRRVIGKVMTIIALFLLLQSVFSAYLPGIFYGPPVPWKVMVEISFFADQGIFGVAQYVVANYLVVFMVFTGFLVASGTAEWFVKLSLSLAGRFRGGPAKVAVVASSLLATVQGVATTNVAATGCVTIPMMKRIGYQPHFAGAVETVASNGGGFTPPVMSMAAFIMAELLGVSYWVVCLAAIIPSILYYLTTFMTVHFEALKLDLRGLPREEVPPLLPTLREGAHLLLPIIVLVVTIALQWGVGYCALVSTLVLFAVCWLRKDTRWTAAKVVGAFERTGRLVVISGVACGAVGILIGAFYVSGLGPRLSEYIVAVSMGQPFLALLIAGGICLLLGMGMPVIPVYLTLYMMAIPALIKMGFDPLPVHFFILYLSVMSGVTPPVAIPAYVAAGIANAPPMKVALTAARMAFPLFILPFFFVYAPELLGGGTAGQIGESFVTAAIGCVAIAAAFEGFWFWGNLGAMARILLFLGGILLVVPSTTFEIVGLAVLAVGVAGNILLARRRGVATRAT